MYKFDWAKWIVIAFLVAILAIAVIVGVIHTKADANAMVDTMYCDSEPAKTHALSFDLKTEFERLGAVLEQLSNDIAENDSTCVYEEPTYVYEESNYVSGYSGNSTATTTHDLLNGQGRAYDENGTSYTYYNHDIGNGTLDIPDETFDSDGVSHDGDGYIVVASDDYAKGEVIDTPYGQAKVYDTGSGSGTVDIYTNR